MAVALCSTGECKSAFLFFFLSNYIFGISFGGVEKGCACVCAREIGKKVKKKNVITIAARLL